MQSTITVLLHVIILPMRKIGLEFSKRYLSTKKQGQLFGLTTEFNPRTTFVYSLLYKSLNRAKNK